LLRVARGRSSVRSDPLGVMRTLLLTCLGLSALLVAAAAVSRPCTKRWRTGTLLALEHQRLVLLLYGLGGVLTFGLAYFLSLR
jgi:hypothetical protein